MGRVSRAADILKARNVASVLDIGARRAELAKFLPSSVDYAAADLFPDEEGRVRYVGDFMTIDIPGKYDAVVALDILEHLESPSTAFDRLVGLANRFVIVSLPNCYCLKMRWQFLNGQLGQKYDFRADEPLDRHRWLMNYKQITSFYSDKAAQHGLGVDVVNLSFGTGNNGLRSLLGQAASSIMPEGLGVETVYGVFQKT